MQPSTPERALRIDAHQHFWRYSTLEYAWINQEMAAIRRDFLPDALAPLLAAAGIDGVVSVQARQTEEETRWLLELARSHSWIRGVVGWLPLAAQGEAIRHTLEAAPSKLKGVRHVLQAEPDSYLQHPQFNAALREVARAGLSYDLLILSAQLPAVLDWVDQHPNLPIVVDHIAKPVITGAPPRDWTQQLQALARRPNVLCKFSGLVTEVPGWRWTPTLLHPYFDAVLDAFGSDRVMFGSDWPVCQVASDYGRWVAFVQECTASLSQGERDGILGGNATRFYRLHS